MSETQENKRAPGYTKRQKQVTINGNSFWADPDLIPLLKALNKVGLEIRSHCAGHTKEKDAFVVIKASNMYRIEVRKDGPYDEVVIGWKRK